MAGRAVAQDDPLAGEDMEGEVDADAEPSEEPETPPAELGADTGAAPTETEAAAPSASAEAEAGASLEGGLEASAGAETKGAPAVALDDRDAPTSPAAPGAQAPDRMAGSHIPRARLMVDGALIIDSPLRTTIEGQESLQMRRQLGGVALPDTTLALGHGAMGTSTLVLRNQPTLILLNGRRLVAAPFWGAAGADLVDINQLPITLISRVETTVGIQSGLYGDGAIGGVVNYVTHRNHEGVEIDVGGQVTDKFDQHEGDVTLTVGVGSEQTGMNAMVSYYNRQPLAASDRDWMDERYERHESILGNPASYQPLFNFVEYPFTDPGCGIATQVGDASGLEVRIPLFGEPTTRFGTNALGMPSTGLRSILPVDTTVDPPVDYAMRYRENFDRARGNDNDILEAGETSTYCGSDHTRFQDLIIEEERIQAYTTFWHAFSDHTEAFGELGYYRSENQNRTSPSFPISRTSADQYNIARVPAEHSDIPVYYRGFATNDTQVMEARVPNSFVIVGSPLGSSAGTGIHERRIDTFRGVLGLRGDFEALGEGSVLESWDWEVAGVHSSSEALSRVPDLLLDKLVEALASCPKTVLDGDVSSPTYMMQIPSTIKDRQEAGCFNPFYSSVINNVAVDPLNVSSASVANERGFPTTDTETMSNMLGYGFQDGGYICDPADPSRPCPPEFDADGDGVFEFAGTPNTKQVVDRISGEHITQERRSLSTADLLLSGDLAQWSGGGLAFALGGQFRRETLAIDYDAAFNQLRYTFVFGAPDVAPVGRNILAGFGEVRLRVADGLLEVQGAARAEHYDEVGAAVSPLAGIALRPFASSGSEPLEWLLVRGHAGLGHRAPSLLQQFGTYTQFHAVEYVSADHFIPHRVIGNDQLDFEKYTTFSGGLQWDWAGIHLAADFWMTTIDGLIGADNTQTLLSDCEEQYRTISVDCPETHFRFLSRGIDHVESPFDNIAEVDTNGVDGIASYTLDTKRRGMGDIGAFTLGVTGRYLNSYLIKGPRVLREYYRSGTQEPVFNPDGTRDYSGLSAEYEAAGYRNIENIASPMPKLRLSVPLRWTYEGHTLGPTMRYIGSYNDDSEATIEKYGLAYTLAAPRATGTLAVEEGETIDAWVVFDFSYGFVFGDFGSDGWEGGVNLGVINLLDEPPPEAESPLAYDMLVHDPRGRMIYARLSGKF
jgi:outer membrane receptor protein involved in Fe transport